LTAIGLYFLAKGVALPSLILLMASLRKQSDTK
jgi:hypothetical protein